MKKVLLSFPNWIGDALLASPSLRALKESRKDVFTVVLAKERVREIFQDSPFVDRLITFKYRIPFNLIPSIFKLRLDTAFLFKPSFTKSFFCKLSGIREIVGYESKKFTFINRRIPLPSQDTHKMDYYLNLLEYAGIKIKRRVPDFFLKEEDFEKANFLLKGVSSKRKVVIHPKANWALKMWPPEYFSKLSDMLIERLEADILITGSSQDKDLAFSILRLMRNRPYILAGRTNLKGLGALLKLVDLVISADTGIMHLASSLKTPLIALFGPTHPKITGPRGEGFIEIIHKEKNCKLPCYKLDCKDNICMKKITPEEVFERAESFLSQSKTK